METIDKKLPIYSLVIDPNDESGVSYVALVDMPAIQKNWQAFSEHKKHTFAINNERRILTGPLMIPDLPIYREDQMGQYYVVFTKDTIYNIVYKYFKQGNTNNVNLMHDDSRIPSGCFMFESFIVDRSRGINPPPQFGDMIDGTWFGSFKINNEDIWNNYVKTGIFNGFSVEGLFEHKYIVDKDQQQIENIANRILSMRLKIKELEKKCHINK